ncbi:MAG: hypothetical protein PF444_00355 [Bacteroidales bacterium]|jgi:hypothetical protein|nr:hypothetical protein [Bacteroidales bacterium]
MKRKYLIIVGVILLVSGIVLKSLGCCGHLPLMMIISGVLCKWTYVILSIVDKTYRPGWEITLLYGGLVVFFTGIYLRHHGFAVGVPVEIMGISMKLVFVALFIRKKKKLRLERNLLK